MTAPIEGKSLAAFGLTGVLAIGGVLAGLPLVSLGLVAVAATWGFALGIRALVQSERDHVAMESIASFEARETYRAILAAYRELSIAIGESRLRETAQPVLERCASAVQLCGQLARSCNPLQRYLDAHDPVSLNFELERLRTRAASATDGRATAAFDHAVRARARQIAIRSQIAATRDRMQARLELVRAAIESFAAMVVNLDVLDDEEVSAAGDNLSAQLTEAADELEIVEGTLRDLAA